MKKIHLNLLVLYATALAGLTSCVSLRQFEEVSDKLDKCKTDYLASETRNNDLKARVMDQESQLSELQNQLKAIRKDTARLADNFQTLSRDYRQLKETYDVFLAKNKETITGNEKELQKMLAELETSQQNLSNKEEALRSLESEMDLKKQKLETLQQELEAKEAKIKELQNILFKKDSVVNALKNKVSNALLGFQGQGLSIEIKNGKVYVFMEEDLLFASAKWEVGPKGREALKKLGEVLEKNPDINILVEGHTDNVPFNGTGHVKDNWDLSVMRATAVVKILLSGSNIKGDRLSASGRSEYVPVEPNKTKEGRARNRRIEIILTPKLDELFKIIETN